jgi:hypothetical protein
MDERFRAKWNNDRSDTGYKFQNVIGHYNYWNVNVEPFASICALLLVFKRSHV